jgi:ectoine hydroxylase-related dioxygenase (phytanoyl-CoA dioxygenase family)
MEPGSALFFHSNLLHQSAQNTSANPRWALICCYNTKHNDPYKDSHHPRYTPIEKVSDDALLRAGVRLSTTAQDYIDPARDKTAEGVKVGS